MTIRALCPVVLLVASIVWMLADDLYRHQPSTWPVVFAMAMLAAIAIDRRIVRAHRARPAPPLTPTVDREPAGA